MGSSNDHEIKLIQQQKLHREREITQQQAVKRSQMETDYLTETYFRNQDVKLNSKMVKSLQKRNKGIGSKLIAPDLPTKEESRNKIKQIENLKDKLLQKNYQRPLLKKNLARLENAYNEHGSTPYDGR